MTKNEREEFTFTELIRVYLEAETLLIKQIEECSSRMMILSQERDQFQKKYDDAFHNERNDERGISNENFIFPLVQSIAFFLSFFQGASEVSLAYIGGGETRPSPPPKS